MVSRAWDSVVSYVTFLVFVSLLLRYLETLYKEDEFVVMFYFITLTGGCKHATLCLWRAEDMGRAIESALFDCGGSLGRNADHQACWREPLPAEPSHFPTVSYFKSVFFYKKKENVLLSCNNNKVFCLM